jgi:hypothetical protein
MTKNASSAICRRHASGGSSRRRRGHGEARRRGRGDRRGPWLARSTTCRNRRGDLPRGRTREASRRVEALILAERAAELRSRHERLRLPDAMVLACAAELEGELLTYDERLAAIGRGASWAVSPWTRYVVASRAVCGVRIRASSERLLAAIALRARFESAALVTRRHRPRAYARQATARASNSARSRSLSHWPAARSNSSRASAIRPRRTRMSPRTLGSRW